MRYNGEYRSLIDLIDDLAGSLPKLNDQYPLDKSNAVEWGVDCLRQIGGNQYVYIPDFYHAKVTNNTVEIPKGTHQITGIYLSSNEGLVNSRLSPSGLVALRYAGDPNNVLLCKQCENVRANNRSSFSIRYPFITFNFTDSYVCIFYNKFVTDDRGIPMYPDDINVSEAIKAYILWKWMHEAYLLDDIKGDKYSEITQQKSLTLTAAKNNFIMPDILEARGLVEQINNRYKNFKIPK